MNKRLLPALALALALGAACGDENPLNQSISFSGLWSSKAGDGSALLFELEQLGSVVRGSAYIENVSGRIGPYPVENGAASGESVSFDVDFSGLAAEGVVIDTFHVSGALSTANVLNFTQYVCASGDCNEIARTAIREPSGF